MAVAMLSADLKAIDESSLDLKLKSLSLGGQQQQPSSNKALAFFEWLSTADAQTAVSTIKDNLHLLTAVRDKLPALQEALADALVHVSLDIKDLLRLSGPPNIQQDTNSAEGETWRYISLNIEVGPNKELWSVTSEIKDAQGDRTIEIDCGMWEVSEETFAVDDAPFSSLRQVNQDVAMELLGLSGITAFKYGEDVFERAGGYWSRRAIWAFIKACGEYLDNEIPGINEFAGYGSPFEVGWLVEELDEMEQRDEEDGVEDGDDDDDEEDEEVEFSDGEQEGYHTEDHDD